MGVEIERKYLIRRDLWTRPGSGSHIVQGYLCEDAGRTLRIRIRDDRGILTIKGPSVGATRAEYEYDIPLTDARELIDLCAERVVHKTRYKVPIGDHIWDVDEFSDANAPLLLAEIELDSEAEAFELPSWIGSEVTQDLRFANYSLACSPYSHWSE